MNQGRSVYLDMCSRSIRSVVGLTSLQLQVRTVLAAWMLARSSLFSDQWLSLVLFNILEFLRKSKDTERHLKYAWNESLFHALVLGTFIKPGLSPAWQGRALMQHRKVFVFFVHLAGESQNCIWPTNIFQHMVGGGHYDVKKVGS